MFESQDSRAGPHPINTAIGQLQLVADQLLQRAAELTHEERQIALEIAICMAFIFRAPPGLSVRGIEHTINKGAILR